MVDVLLKLRYESLDWRIYATSATQMSSQLDPTLIFRTVNTNSEAAITSQCKKEGAKIQNK